MCGIAGIIAPRLESGRLRQAIEDMVAEQVHRGPDAQSFFVDPDLGCALGHDRLSILELSPAGAQPMQAQDGQTVICYNGEIYNFEDLRRNLPSGIDYRGHSDTEVLIEAYREMGVDAFKRLNGMFAFAILDKKRGEVILVRDRLGIKPLFYAQCQGAITFASEIKGLLASGLVENAPDYSRLHEYLYFGSTLGEATMFAGIKQLPPGTWTTISLETGVMADPVTYWSVAELPDRSDVSESEAIERTRELLDAAVKRQLASDVPVGAFLSGGVDSSAIVALATRHYEGRLRTYTVGFDYIGDGDELPQARKVAERFGTDHHELHVSGGDTIATIESLAHAHDQPFADPANLPLYQLCKALEGETKVILQGDGGDEIFGGYRRYVYLTHMAMMQPASRAIDAALSLLRGRFGPRVFGAHRFFHALSQKDPAERMALLMSVEGPYNPPAAILSSDIRYEIERQDPFRRYREVSSELSSEDALQQMLHTDLQILLPDIFLEKVDRSTMAVSTEVRVPFLDFDLVDYVASLPAKLKVRNGKRKFLLRNVLETIVPDEILNARKVGFGVPVKSWLAGPLRDYAQERILGQSSPSGLFDAEVVNRHFEEHASGRRDHGQLLWKCLQLTFWHEKFVQPTST